MPTPADVLCSSIEAHNDTFEALLRLIPPKYYLVKDEDTDGMTGNKFAKHSKKQKAPKQPVKEAAKKARREKLDPANEKSVIDLQNEDALQHERSSKKDKGKQKASPPPSHSDSSVVSSEDEDDDSERDKSMQMDDDMQSNQGGNSHQMEMVPMPKTESITVLREKLHARMAALRRGGGGEPGDRDELLEERRKQRATLREKRRKETKERKRAEKEKEKVKGQDSKVKTGPVKNQLLVPNAATSTGPSSNHDGPLTNVAFSAISGSTSKKAAQFKSSNNPSQALSQLSARKERLATLPDDKRKAVEEKDRWTKAEALLEGVKVKDNEALLKKAMKRKEKEKVRSKKKWDERKEQVVTQMAARQKKKADNIAMRNERRNEKRKGKGKTKARPGFEGKSYAKGKSKALAKK
ncbi:hypothetical protein ID866_8964 [Astraeus odoratus]|nr:hypothetical protein ID866_8964 [Astraeus odoratus]